MRTLGLVRFVAIPSSRKDMSQMRLGPPSGILDFVPSFNEATFRGPGPQAPRTTSGTPSSAHSTHSLFPCVFHQEAGFTEAPEIMLRH